MKPSYTTLNSFHDEVVEVEKEIYVDNNESSHTSSALDTSPPRPFNISTTSSRELPVLLPFGTTPPSVSHFETLVMSSKLLENECNASNLSDSTATQSSSFHISRPQSPTQNNVPVLQHPSFIRSGFNSPRPLPLFNNPTPIPRPVSRPSSVDWTLKLFKLEDFIFAKTVGTGTFGRVRLVKLRDHDKYFAMKIMRKADIVRLHQVDHIFSEKFLLSRLSCPFIIRLYGTFQDYQNLYMLLEYAIGGELFTYLRRAGRFNEETTKFYAAEIICALEYMHALNIVYRDLKPENLLLDARGHIKIADFGFAKIIPDNRTWTLCGTPEYLAPEIILGRGHGRSVDWWALGILIYEMMAGFPPYYDETPFLIYEKILAGKLEFPPHFDANLCDLLTGLLQPDPQRRLGCGPRDAFDVKTHPWFNDINWDDLSRRLVSAPFVPTVQHPGDTANFEEYPEDDLESLVLNDFAIGEDVNINHIFTEF